MRHRPWTVLLAGLLLVVLVAFGALQWHARYRFRTRGLPDGFPAPVMDTPGGGGAPVSRLCVNAPLLSYRRDALDEALDWIEDGGFDWVRFRVTPADMLPSPNPEGKTRLDLAISAAQARGLRPWVVLYGDSPHPESWDDGPPDPEAFSQLAGTVAERYGEDIDYYQIWHNPNLGSDWGGRANAFEYAALLSRAGEAIRTADPGARIVLGSLAPTTEVGEINYAEDLFLELLYEAGAGDYFDLVAVQPYGFETGPDDRRVGRDVLNASRAVLVRETLVAHGDEEKAVWAADFGWNSMSAELPGPPSIWGRVDETNQAVYTVEMLERIQREWPWMGVACLNGLQPRPGDVSAGGGDGVPDAEAHWGFALITPAGDPRSVYDAVRAWALAQTDVPVAHTGVYRADTDLATFEGPWTLGPLGADIGEHAAGEEPRVRFTFEGTGVALTVRRGPYRAFLYVEVDGEPAPALPTDREGRAYVVLYDPLAATATVPLAVGLAPGRHTVEVAAVRGWGQWALADWRVTWAPAGRLLYLWGLAGFASLGLLGVAAAIWAAPRVRRQHGWPGIVLVWGRVADWVKVVGSLLLGAITLFAAWQTIMSETLFRRLGERGEVAALALTTGLFYFSPWAVLTAVGGLALSILVFLQPGLGLMLTVTAMPFYAYPLSLVGKSFALAELVLLPTLAGWALRYAGLPASDRAAARARLSKAAGGFLRPLALFVVLAVLSGLAAQHRREALRELRLVVLEPALLFLALVTLPMGRRERRRIIDGLVLGGVLVALIGLVQYFLLGRVITAEGGIRRLVSIYGSPNNVGLQMGRLLPILLAVALWGGASDDCGWVATLAGSRRRLLYLIAALPVGLALLLSLSRGALLLGVPAAFVTLGLLAGPAWRKATLVAVAAGVLAPAVLLGFPQLLGPRFAGMLDLSQGSESFRVALWHSTLAMIGDHPLLGVGPDNFLYAYRTRYVLPSAWEEFNLSHPHNVALDFAARLGIGGLAALVWMQVVFWRRALPLRRLGDPRSRALALGVMASMADFLAHGLVDASYFLIDLAYIYMVSLAAVVWLSQVEQPRG